MKQTLRLRMRQARNKPHSVLVWLIASLALHGVAFASVRRVFVSRPRQAESSSTIDLVVSKSAPAEPVEDKVSPLATMVITATPLRRAGSRQFEARRAAPEESVQPGSGEEEPSAISETPVGFDDVILTHAEKAEPWAAGSATGPKTSSKAAPSGSGGGPSSGGLGVGGHFSPPQALSRRPVPPNLDSALARNYPQKAKADGIEASVLVRAQINADGSVSAVHVQRESVAGYGFGLACRNTLERAQWKPPLDSHGRAVATIVSYHCQFQISD